MIDSPASLSDEELEIIMHDDELREIHEASSAVSSASVSKADYDMTEEWDRFRPRIRRKPSLTLRFMRVAAVFLGIAVAANVIVKVIDHTLAPDQQPTLAKVEQPTDKEEGNASDQEKKEMGENVEQADPLTEPKQPEMTHLAKAEAAATTATELDVDEYLRIQQAQVENEIAMLNGEMVVDELATLRQMYELMGERDESFEKIINNITEL